MASKTAQSILRTLLYFDIFKYPLSRLEIWRWHDEGCDEQTIEMALNELSDQNVITCRHGLWCIASHEDAINQRLQRYAIAINKNKKARRIATILSYFPFVRAIAICGSLAYKNSSAESDIDLFIVAQDKHIWTARFFVSLFLKLFRLRPEIGNSKDKICCSFFISNAQQNLGLINHYRAETHFHYWISYFNFIYGDAKSFFAANAWLKEVFPNWYPMEASYRMKTWQSSFFMSFKKFAEYFFGFSENILKRLQIKTMPKKYLALEQAHQDVIISDMMIKLHANAKRDRVSDLLAMRLKQWNV